MRLGKISLLLMANYLKNLCSHLVTVQVTYLPTYTNLPTYLLCPLFSSVYAELPIYLRPPHHYYYYNRNDEYFVVSSFPPFRRQSVSQSLKTKKHFWAQKYFRVQWKGYGSHLPTHFRSPKTSS